MSRFISGYKMTVLNTSNEKLKIIFLFADGQNFIQFLIMNLILNIFVRYCVSWVKWIFMQRLEYASLIIEQSSLIFKVYTEGFRVPALYRRAIGCIKLYLKCNRKYVFSLIYYPRRCLPAEAQNFI